jgi:hypothetical protein
MISFWCNAPTDPNNETQKRPTPDTKKGPKGSRVKQEGDKEPCSLRKIEAKSALQHG